eukprot:TRINITY_DN9384_c1_g1_i1.p1 TRINITY_DN9384_c1_g1~~TRINITY_DN9384_c1_g1_i1.p1  ORF type:complete len:295 (+),score=28.53 TRINITY_DN9384_c1_g1_i1:20-904(+)
MSRRDFTATVHSSSYPFISPLQHSNLVGQHVLITGAAWEDGVGFATAKAFARAGASVIILVDLLDIPLSHKDKLCASAIEAGRAPPPEIILAPGIDISSRASVAFMRDGISRLDILINNAAHQEPYSSLLDSNPDVYWRTWEVNMGGLINMARAFLPLLLAAPFGGGTMINLSSSGALSVRSGSSSYRTSKLAVMRWTEALSFEHHHEEADGLFALSVNPGAIKTHMTINEPEKIRNALPHKPDIAGDTIVWLAATRLSWLSGRYVSCPWDMEELMARKEEIIEGDKLKMKMAY